MALAMQETSWTEQKQADGPATPVTEIEQATGLTREVIRKWEVRYGFPQPARGEHGERLYPADQVAMLRLIRRLLDAGMRPAKVVGLDCGALEELVWSISEPPAGAPPEPIVAVLDALRSHDHAELVRQLTLQVHRQGLSRFVCETMTRLNVAVGEAWLRGELRIFQEHLYTKVVGDVVQAAVGAIGRPAGWPRVLLTTMPGERHTLGLLMAEAVLTVEGACCIGLGAQTPVAELVATVDAYAIDVVALSFSLAHPARTTAPLLRSLRDSLPPEVDLWAGGAGMGRVPPLPGVRALHDLDSIVAALAEKRSRRRYS
ncbi:MerR family transcriptional regulator [Azospirillum sp. CT11-132]|uniref:MerR family transcriptional regulator n=1 Tax=Azospirillum sp. CT11-132 TaxID=3396317 RepID=UPI0039A6F058